jgi:hypothetical protein
MTIIKYPEDSVLRRHFDSTVDFKRQLWLQTPPSDSILRRHAGRLDGHTPVHHAAPAKKKSATASLATQSQQRPAKKDGFFARLFGLLSGRA